MFLAVFVVLVSGFWSDPATSVFSRTTLLPMSLVPQVGLLHRWSRGPSRVASAYETTFRWAEPLFGETPPGIVMSCSRGRRQSSRKYRLRRRDRHARPPTFSAFGIEQCYQFHGYSLFNVFQVSMGGGIHRFGIAMTLRSTATGRSSIGSFRSSPEVQHLLREGLLYVQDRQGGVIAPSTEGQRAVIKSLAGSLDPNDPKELVLLQNRYFLVG